MRRTHSAVAKSAANELRGRGARGAHRDEGRAGTKWVMGYSIKTGLLEEGICGAETSAEIPMWRQLAPSLTRGVLYVLDLGFFERQLFVDALAAGAHVLMRLKSNVKVRVVGHLYGRTLVALPDWSPRPATAESRRPCTARRPRAPRPPVQQQRNLGAHAPLADPARRGLPCRGLLAWPTLRKWVSP
ncbi:MAG: transposase, partial [Polyangiaceae bacterium]|nr:transposase [Polyangiaceae bacterium]